MNLYNKAGDIIKIVDEQFIHNLLENETNLSSVHIKDKSFSQVNISSSLGSAYLENIEFHNCTFKKVDLMSATFDLCMFINCRFEDCNMYFTGFCDCKFFTASFEINSTADTEFNNCMFIDAMIQNSCGMIFEFCSMDRTRLI